MKARGLACVALGLALTLPLPLATESPARADTPPSRWEIAKDPLVRPRYDLHVKVRELLSLDGRTPAAMRSQALERARALLEEFGAATSPDLRLRFDLGEVYEQLNHHERAVAVLRPAVDANPEHPAAIEAMVALAYAYAKLDRAKDERDAYRRYIARVVDERSRATALLNLAEAEMHLGNLPDAVAGYRDAIALAQSIPNSMAASESMTLSVWGLAVALDRAGEPQEALEQASLATKLDPGEQIIGHGRNVFFVPEYERQWYLGLAEIVHARAASGPRDALRAWLRAEAHWQLYVSAAEATDRYLALARAHLAQAKARAARLRTQLGEKRGPFVTGDPADR